MPSGVVYLVRVGDLHKIGTTRNLALRMNAIGLELKMPVWVLHTWQTRTPRVLERYLHGMLNACRLAGEWFRLGHSELERLRHFRLDAPALIASDEQGTAYRERTSRPKVKASMPPLGILLAGYGIPKLTVLAKQLGIGKQHAWLLWHGKIALSLEVVRRLHEEMQVPLDRLMQIERAIPAQKRGRKMKVVGAS
jgi:hypothetical protein